MNKHKYRHDEPSCQFMATKKRKQLREQSRKEEEALKKPLKKRLKKPAEIESTTEQVVKVESIKKTPKNKGVWNALSNFSQEKMDGAVIITLSIVGIASVLYFSTIYLPNVYNNTEYAASEKSLSADIASSSSVAAQQIKDKKDEDAKILGKTKLVLTTNKGVIKIMLSDKTTVTTDNMLRIASRGLYNNTVFHRIVKQDGFNIIQGGDYEKQDGTGGSGALSKTIVDEIFETMPEYNDNGVANKPVYKDTTLLSEFSYKGKNGDGKPIVGTVYPKGTVSIANRGANTGGSQFFINLTDNINLSPDYTSFGQLDADSLLITDAILQNTNVGADGVKPDQEIKIITATIE
jgi:peptidyl-prolyl cis-trans isomerase B (cyclophilin B)